MTVGYRGDGGWTIDDLFDLPDDGLRYEIADGRLLVSPAPATPHVFAVTRLHVLLHDMAPRDLAIVECGGVEGGNNYNYFIPDLLAMPWSRILAHPKYLLRADVQLAGEVLSEHNRSRDLVLKRRHYASMRIPRYWIVDPAARTLTVLAIEGEHYTEETTVKAGNRWRTDVPFPLELDPADFCP